MPKRTPRHAVIGFTLAGLSLVLAPWPYGASTALAQNKTPLPPAPSVFESASFERAKAMSEEQGKVLYVCGVSAGCTECWKMDAEVFSNPRVAAWLHDNAVCVRLDGQDGSAASIALRMGPYPTHVFIKDNDVVDRMDGYLDVGEFLSLAKGAARGRTTSQRVEQEYRRALRNGHERNIDKRYSLAVSLLTAKNYEVATEEFAFLWKNVASLDPRYVKSRYDQGGMGGKIKELISKYPPARETFTEFRDELTPKVDPSLGADNIRTSDVQEWVALNVVLRDSPTLVAWANDIVDNHDVAILHKGGEPLFDALATQGQWRTMGFVFEDPMTYVQMCAQQYGDIIKTEMAAKAALTEKFANMYAACLAADRVQDAMQVASFAASVVGRAMAYDRLRLKAEAAEIPEEMREVWYRGDYGTTNE